MVLEGVVKPRVIDNYVNQTLMINLTFSDAIETMKKILCVNPLVHMADLEKHLNHFPGFIF